MSRPVILDFHTQIFPGNPIEKLLSFRKQAKAWMQPVAQALHWAQPWVRHLPDSIRASLDEVSGVVPLTGLLLESSVADLKESMALTGIRQSVVVAQSPWSSNEWVLEMARQDSEQALIPAVNFSRRTERPGVLLKRAREQGARLLKLHPAFDGESETSARYLALIRKATELQIPILLHTGCAQSHLYYANPALASAQRFEKWFQKFPETPFILAHMNFHDPSVALDLCERYPQLWVETSWQPAEVIAEAVRRLGAERIVFGSGWPFVGNNAAIGLQRIQRCLESGLISQEQAQQILGSNAQRLLRQ
jgi:predicted TIM-barrel fold metal-dependent hydrolase